MGGPERHGVGKGDLMSLCTIAFCLANLYVSGQIEKGQEVRQLSQGAEGTWCQDHICSGPVGVLTLGMRVNVTRSLTLEYGILHKSYITEGDRGYEVPFAKLEWRPFQ